MKTTLIAATALTLSAAALAQDYSQPVNDSASVTRQDVTIAEPDSAATQQEVPDPALDPVTTDATTMAPPAADATSPAEIRPDTTLASEGTAVTRTNLQTFAGMGGPYEEVYSGAPGTLNLQPRPAEGNYPPCNPGPGDDRCIQLYEPGVRMQLASWNQPTGGLADGSATTAMGGPYEPVDDATAAADTGAPVDGSPADEAGKATAGTGDAKPAGEGSASTEPAAPKLTQAGKAMDAPKAGETRWVNAAATADTPTFDDAVIVDDAAFSDDDAEIDDKLVDETAVADEAMVDDEPATAEEDKLLNTI